MNKTPGVFSSGRSKEKTSRNCSAGVLVLLLTAVIAALPPHRVSLSGQFLRRARPSVTEAHVRGHMEMLAGDALNGRASGSRDEWTAATYVASQLRHWGLEPLGDEGGFVQTVPVNRAGAAPPARTWNVIGQLAGSDSRRAGQVILLSAHLDGLGVRGTGADAIFNGADDDASGITAVLELARVLSLGRRPPRTIVFAWFGSEESGGFGSRHFVEHPPVPLPSIVANLQFEMIGRPDPAVPDGTLWLTGYNRSTLGAQLANRGARIVADPHPEEDFFRRSDNIRFAYRGVVAHTVSSYGLHRDYHTPDDELEAIDFAHLTAAIRSMVEPIRWLAASSFVPEWHPGMQPESGRRPGP